ncbi:hypothetical protein U27_02782 [Candidatus Vecturithrix granuli]|uniref:DUF1573 domain-containing protein n=1 Tax=Vecturithrix granuli TaxID=1499967 RepID=A0A081BU18_VECG1|nr:hypothetical protein U27_02782 [Candidatus Vecturithrix granuli]
MKKSSILIGMLWVFFLVGEGQSVHAAPRLEIVGGPTYDFGEVQANQTLTHTFVLKNTGDSVLRIQQAKGG